jgi:hypothetical protein
VLDEHLVLGRDHRRDRGEVALAAGEGVADQGQITPNSAPITTVERRTPRTPSSVNRVKIRPMNRPSQTPEISPPRATRPVVSRPVMRSTRLRSVPTIMQFWTGNSLSERKSTAFCAAA